MARRSLSTFGKVLVGSLGLGLVSVVLAGVWYKSEVIDNPGPEFTHDAIYSVIDQESPVFYADGETRLGVFFDDEHRNFVGWDELPAAYVASIVAAEDGNFFHHPGFDPKHIARAMRDNLRAGRLVAGGSTLTQQTAKNLFYRPDRSLKAKLNEAGNALRLEAHFDKKDILTFYANQFHVSGNGRGLGIAARYFFSKDVSELSVLESAFLAGLVKAPSYYDPFLGSLERQEKAIAKGQSRTRYVLRRLTEVDPARVAGPTPHTPEEAQDFSARVKAIEKAQVEAAQLLELEELPLHFSRGQFRFESNVVLDEVKRRLGQAPFDTILAELDITLPNLEGLQVITTLDPDVQRWATYGLWHHLSEAGSWLEERTLDDFILSGARPPRVDPRHQDKAGEFNRAVVVGPVEVDGRRALMVDLGARQCLVDRDALVRAAAMVARSKAHDPRVKVDTAQVEAVIDHLVPESVVWVSVRQPGEPSVCDLEVRPELQGAVVVTQEGRVRAMVGGKDNRDFNRATAQRQIGSAWKPLVYQAALELDWEPTDLLDNAEAVFPYSTTLYVPRAAHRAADELTMAWAGVHSENRASIWLLYHLLDRVPLERLEGLAQVLGLAREPAESMEDYRTRMNRLGVHMRASRLSESDFVFARTEVLATLEGSPHPEDDLPLLSMLSGYAFDTRARDADDSTRRLMQNHYGRLSERWERCQADYLSWQSQIILGSETALPIERLLTPLRREPVLPEGSFHGRWVDGRLEIACDARVDFSPLDDTFPFEGGLQRDMLPPVDDLLIGGVHGSTMQRMATAIRMRELLREGSELQSLDLYEPRHLYGHQDFRVLMAIRYVKQLAESYGVRSEIEEVLSLPLGASTLTAEESALVYGGLVTGTRWTFPGETTDDRVVAPEQPSLMISELRDVRGKVLYRAVPQASQMTTPAVAAQTGSILQQVVEHGTGRRAGGLVWSGDRYWPLLGKTGTTNDYRNATFVGVVPVQEEGADTPSLAAGYSIAAYVGYDDNTPMKVGNTRVDGAKGALPVWARVVRGLWDEGLLGAETVDRADWIAQGESLGLLVQGIDGPPSGLPVPVMEPSGPWVYVREPVWMPEEPEPEGLSIELPEVELAPASETRRQRRRRERRRP